jgi:hypothetical protein
MPRIFRDVDRQSPIHFGMMKNRSIAVDFDTATFELDDQFSRDIICYSDADLGHLLERVRLLRKAILLLY